LIQRLIRKYKIKINNKKSKANSQLNKGDVIYLYYKFEFNNDFQSNIKLTKDSKDQFTQRILYQNHDFLIINKLKGYSVQRGSKVYISLKDYYESLLKTNLYIVHRLDKDTSGLMIFAKNRLAASKISKLFLNNKINKYYIANTNSLFNKSSGLLNNTNAENKNLKLLFRRIYLNSSSNTYLIKLLTGKKHQIRLQFFLNNNPIIGDKKFNSKSKFDLQLSSVSLNFIYDEKFYKFKLSLNQIFQ
jgi:23S rRNA-/tRNA-specific pseudouridylate synthase